MLRGPTSKTRDAVLSTVINDGLRWVLTAPKKTLSCLQAHGTWMQCLFRQTSTKSLRDPHPSHPEIERCYYIDASMDKEISREVPQWTGSTGMLGYASPCACGFCLGLPESKAAFDQGAFLSTHEVLVVLKTALPNVSACGRAMPASVQGIRDWMLSGIAMLTVFGRPGRDQKRCRQISFA